MKITSVFACSDCSRVLKSTISDLSKRSQPEYAVVVLKADVRIQQSRSRSGLDAPEYPPGVAGRGKMARIY